MDDGAAADSGREAGGDDADGEPAVGPDAEPTAEADAEPAAGAGREPADPDGEAAADTGEPPAGLVTVRGAIYGVALLWLAAVAGFGALQAAVYGATTATPYLLLAVAAAALSVTAGYASLRAFGLR